MDKLRAIQYFIRAVEAGSFSAAARSFEVSTPAVTQLVAELERSLGIVLVHRSARGLLLTEDGERYYETSQRLVTELHDVEQRVGSRGAKPRGTLTVGMRPVVAERCVLPRIGSFVERFPDIELVTKPLTTLLEVDEKSMDLAVLIGWPPKRDLVIRHLIQARHVVCASPDYWMREGKPSDPNGLVNHHCLVVRSMSGILLDRWAFERDGERRTIDVKTRLSSNDGSWLEEAACGGAGVARFPDLAISRSLSSGLLVPVLSDWEALEAPTIFCAYRRNRRNSKLVQVFVGFLADVFADIERQRAVLGSNISRVPKPAWFGRAYGRRSAYSPRGKAGA